MIDSETLAVSSTVWIWRPAEGKGSWHFITLKDKAAESIRAHEAMRRMELGRGRGFGSVKVEVRIGRSQWRTSVFPSKDHGGYLLPIKADIRKAELLQEGDRVSAIITPL